MTAVAAALAAALVAYAATRLLAPDADQLLPVADVRAEDFFSAAQVERGKDYRGPQTLIGLGSLVAQVVLLGLLARRPPAWLPRRTAPAGALLSVLLVVVTLPFGAVAKLRAQDVGLSTQSWAGWAFDHLLSAAIGAVFTAVLAVVVVALARRLPRTWWLPGSAIVLVAAAAITFASPLVLDPVFNDFRRLPDGPLRSDTLALARAAGLEVDTIEVMDASRRTTAANAYIAGLGSSKKVVIYDNLIEDFPRAETKSVLAHELGHERYDDVPRGLLFVAVVAPFAMFAVARMVGRVEGSRSLPALGLAFTVVSTGVLWISNDLSRAVEARADSWALEQTRDPAAFTALQRRLDLTNVSDPDPPGIVQAVLGTHPTTLERLGMAAAFSRPRGGS